MGMRATACAYAVAAQTPVQAGENEGTLQSSAQALVTSLKISMFSIAKRPMGMQVLQANACVFTGVVRRASRNRPSVEG